MVETRPPKGKKIPPPSPFRKKVREEDLAVPEIGDRFKDYTTGKVFIVKKVAEDGTVVMAGEEGLKRRIIGLETLNQVCEKMGGKKASKKVSSLNPVLRVLFQVARTLESWRQLPGLLASFKLTRRLKRPQILDNPWLDGLFSLMLAIRTEGLKTLFHKDA